MRNECKDARNYSQQTAGGADDEITIAPLLVDAVRDPAAAERSQSACRECRHAQDDVRTNLAHAFLFLKQRTGPRRKCAEHKRQSRITSRRKKPVSRADNTPTISLPR